MSRPPPTLSRFDADTAVTSLGDGRFTSRIDRGWWVQSGPNGGYLAAILLRAMRAAVDDPARAARALHVRFLKAPAEGPVELQTRVLRAGRSLTSMAASMHQAGAELVRADATFSTGFSEIEFSDAAMPEARPIAEAEAIEKRIPLNDRFDMWRAIGGEFRSSDRALTGGWIRLADPRAADALLLAALWDAWPPAMFARAMQTRFRGAVPTVEVSIHFRETFPLPGLAADSYLLLRVETLKAHAGIVEESGEVWTADGTLLAQSRQLALLL